MAKKKNSNKSRLPTDVDAVIGARITLARRMRGMAREELAQRLGIAFQQVQKYESAANRVPASRLWEIANVLGLPLSYFFGNEDIIPQDLAFRFDADSGDLLREFQPLSKSKRRLVRQLLVQLGKIA